MSDVRTFGRLTRTLCSFHQQTLLDAVPDAPWSLCSAWAKKKGGRRGAPSACFCTTRGKAQSRSRREDGARGRTPLEIWKGVYCHPALLKTASSHPSAPCRPPLSKQRGCCRPQLSRDLQSTVCIRRHRAIRLREWTCCLCNLCKMCCGVFRGGCPGIALIERSGQPVRWWNSRSRHRSWISHLFGWDTYLWRCRRTPQETEAHLLNFCQSFTFNYNY